MLKQDYRKGALITVVGTADAFEKEFGLTKDQRKKLTVNARKYTKATKNGVFVEYSETPPYDDIDILASKALESISDEQRLNLWRRFKYPTRNYS